ncbi:Sister chromatid cohesion protein [Schizosaccharomyces pombe]|uniref:MIP18 family protein C144.16 n=1 Tax=Schizosaccharomyces pombe (strain 972 / ATCC 24843) TaxID=284812 RepID=YIVG_SCHPO|nr:putative sister chromatid cohesion protein [Schizosaccharomyces pombe]Q9UTL0.1 RecName: Full=MIP18 family protein C144.16 [Schizosaccharomyces pombe 972h-]CAB59696.1 sister chromatid cohesion protein (predicted) [Schizosaccharomyces pombe]|eukprot:NP_594677.1 putative sister chromatid cohesion protein [Schizosaccharomyces pombe]
MSANLQNENPEVKELNQLPSRVEEEEDLLLSSTKQWLTEIESEQTNIKEERDPIDPQEIYDLLAKINDPEHPLTLAQLSVVKLEDIEVVDNVEGDSYITVHITPTIPHCSMCTLIGLCIRVRLERCLPPRFHVDVKVKKGTHASESQVNKQLNDKERVAAACENEQLLSVLNGMMATCV